MFDYAVALTGSISTGKSTVASLLKLHGLQAIDADAVAHEQLRENSAEVANLFGSEYLNGQEVDRKKLGGLIFSDKVAKKALEEFLHPKIRDVILQRSERFEKLKFPYLIDIPLFFETSAYKIDHVAVVYATREIQLERIIKRDKMTKIEAELRIDAQMDIELKKKRADWVIDNCGDLVHLQDECEKFVQKVRASFGV